MVPWSLGVDTDCCSTVGNSTTIKSSPFDVSVVDGFRVDKGWPLCSSSVADSDVEGGANCDSWLRGDGIDTGRVDINDIVGDDVVYLLMA